MYFLSNGPIVLARDNGIFVHADATFFRKLDSGEAAAVCGILSVL